MNQIRNPFSRMLVSFAPDMFFGRYSVIEPILQGVSSKEPRSFVIHGVRTIGKTSLLRYLCDPKGAVERQKSALLDYGPGLFGELEFIYMDCYSVDGVDILPSVYKGLLRSEKLRQLEDRFPAAEDVDSIAEPEVRKVLLDSLRLLQNEGIRIVICLDHFDKAFQSMEYGDDVFLRNLTDLQSFIAATERSLPELRQDSRRTSPLLNVLIPRNIRLLTETESRELIEIPARGVGAPFAQAEVDFILETAGRQPYLLTIACELLFDMRAQYPEVRKLLLEDKKTQQQVKLQLMASSAINELFLLFWDQLQENERRTLSKIATQGTVTPETDVSALNSLRQMALAYENLQEAKYHVFSELFRDYVLSQRYPRRGGTEQISDSLGRLDRRLYEYMLARPNQLCTFEELLREVWGDLNASKRGLEAAIHRLRTRLQDVDATGWAYIRNVRGKGYVYVPKSR